MKTIRSGALVNKDFLALEPAYQDHVAEFVRCKDCKYNLNNDRLFADPDPILTYAWCNTEVFQENDFCSKGKINDSKLQNET